MLPLPLRLQGRSRVEPSLKAVRAPLHACRTRSRVLSCDAMRAGASHVTERIEQRGTRVGAGVLTVTSFAGYHAQVISPQDTGATCYFKDCDQKFTTCSDDNKCLCIPGFVYMAGHGGYGGCQRNPSLFPPNIQWSAADDAHRWEQSHPPPQPNVKPVPAPPPTVASESSCARHSQCAGLAGNCCPNDLGLSLSCCR